MLKVGYPLLEWGVPSISGAVSIFHMPTQLLVPRFAVLYLGIDRSLLLQIFRFDSAKLCPDVTLPVSSPITSLVEFSKVLVPVWSSSPSSNRGKVAESAHTPYY